MFFKTRFHLKYLVSKQIINLFISLLFFRKKKDAIDPLLFKYKVQPTKKELYECAIVKATQIR